MPNDPKPTEPRKHLREITAPLAPRSGLQGFMGQGRTAYRDRDLPPFTAPRKR